MIFPKTASQPIVIPKAKVAWVRLTILEVRVRAAATPA
jgi:hypothetical protein